VRLVEWPGIGYWLKTLFIFLMNIVILDGYTMNPGDNPWDPVAKLGSLAIYDRTAPDEIIARSAEAEVLVTNKVELTGERIAALPRLRFIAVTATGFNIVDTAAARERGIPVSNVPAYSSAGVAQQVFALLLECTNRVGLHDEAVQAGEWTACPDFSFTKSPLVELAGKSIGIFGFGDIGRRVGRIAHAFGMEVLACSRRQVNFPDYGPFRWVDRETLFREADVVTLHAPQTAETAGMVNKSLLSLMKRSAFLINTARGGLVVEKDLADSLNEGRLAGAAVDVVSREPIQAGNPLLGARNCFITPHLAWATLAARRRLMAKTAENIAAFQRGEPINVVNG
jgi:glycerate dehydrogenase